MEITFTLFIYFCLWSVISIITGGSPILYYLRKKNTYDKNKILFYLFLSLYSGVLVFTTLVFLLSHVFGFNKYLIWFLFILMTIHMIYELKKLNFSLNKHEIKKILLKNIMNLDFILPFMISLLFFFFFTSSWHIERNNVFYYHHAAWGDMPRHFGIITTLTNNNFPPIEPLYPEKNLFYHYFANFHSAILSLFIGKTFFHTLSATLFSNILIIFLTGQGLVYFSKIFTKRKWIQIFFVFIVIFGSGFTYAPYAKKIIDTHTVPNKDLFISSLDGNPGFKFSYGPSLDPNHAPNIPPPKKLIKKILKGEYFGFNDPYIPLEKFSSVILFMLPERSTLYGFSLLIATLVIFFYVQSSKQISLFDITLIGCLAGLNSQFHVYNTPTLGLTCNLMILLTAKQKLKQLLFFNGGFLLALLPQLITMVSETKTSSHISKNLGWYSISLTDVLIFSLYNYGFVLLFFMLSIFYIKYKKRQCYVAWSLAMPTFVLMNILQFGTSVWDNHHFVPAVWLGLCAGTICLFSINNKHFKWFHYVIIFLIGSQIVLGGFLELMYHNVTLFPLFNQYSLNACMWIQENLPEKSIFISEGNHNNCVPYIGGRFLVKGFDTWLWTYGIDYSKERKFINQIFSPQNKEVYAHIQKELNADYIYVSPSEQHKFGLNVHDFFKNQKCHELYFNKEISVFSCLESSE